MGVCLSKIGALRMQQREYNWAGLAFAEAAQCIQPQIIHESFQLSDSYSSSSSKQSHQHDSYSKVEETEKMILEKD